MSLQGDILQVVTNPTEPKAVFKAICCYGRTLLARYWAGGYWPGTEWDPRESYVKQGILAFRGL